MNYYNLLYLLILSAVFIIVLKMKFEPRNATLFKWGLYILIFFIYY